MNLGEFIHKIDLGEEDHSTNPPTLLVLHTRMAKMMIGTGSERRNRAQEDQTQSITWVTNYASDLHTGMIVEHQGQRHQVVAITPVTGYENRYVNIETLRHNEAGVIPGP